MQWYRCLAADLIFLRFGLGEWKLLEVWSACRGGRSARMGYTRGIVVQYQYQGAGIGIVLVIIKNHLYPIPDQYQSFTCRHNAEIRGGGEITQTNILPITYD